MRPPRGHGKPAIPPEEQARAQEPIYEEPSEQPPPVALFPDLITPMQPPPRRRRPFGLSPSIRSRTGAPT